MSFPSERIWRAIWVLVDAFLDGLVVHPRTFSASHVDFSKSSNNFKIKRRNRE